MKIEGTNNNKISETTTNAHFRLKKHTLMMESALSRDLFNEMNSFYLFNSFFFFSFEESVVICFYFLLLSYSMWIGCVNTE